MCVCRTVSNAYLVFRLTKLNRFPTSCDEVLRCSFVNFLAHIHSIKHMRAGDHNLKCHFHWPKSKWPGAHFYLFVMNFFYMKYILIQSRFLTVKTICSSWAGYNKLSLGSNVMNGWIEATLSYFDFSCIQSDCPWWAVIVMINIGLLWYIFRVFW